GHLLLGGFLHPSFGGSGKGFLQSLLTQRFLLLQANVRFGKSRQNPISFFRKLASRRQGRGWRVRLEPLIADRDHFLAYAARLDEVGNRFRKTDGMGCALIEQVSVVDTVVVVVAEVKTALIGAHSFVEIAALLGQ